MKNESTVYLVRHAERPQIPLGSFGHDLKLTEKGRKQAQDLGLQFQGSTIHEVYASPVPRCIETADCIRSGAQVHCEVQESRALGAPSVYVENPELAGKTHHTKGPQNMLKSILFSPNEAIPGYRVPLEGSRLLYEYILRKMPPEGSVSLMVTHDIVLGAFAAHLLGITSGLEFVPEFCESMKIVNRNDRLLFTYREYERTVDVRSVIFDF